MVVYIPQKGGMMTKGRYLGHRIVGGVMYPPSATQRERRVNARKGIVETMNESQLGKIDHARRRLQQALEQLDAIKRNDSEQTYQYGALANHIRNVAAMTGATTEILCVLVGMLEY